MTKANYERGPAIQKKEDSDDEPIESERKSERNYEKVVKTNVESVI